MTTWNDNKGYFMNTTNKPSKPTANATAVVVKAPAKSAKPITVKKTPAVSKLKANVPDELAGKILVPETPEQKKNSGAKRKRLSKAFLRPLDKKLKRGGALVRDSFNFPEAEYAHLVELKQRLVDDGVDVKKSELLRAGLVLLSSLDEAVLKEFLAKVPRVS
ncbi:MAG: hypothetical protein WCL27_15570 [Betaproteobacteria bacterium]